MTELSPVERQQHRYSYDHAVAPYDTSDGRANAPEWLEDEAAARSIPRQCAQAAWPRRPAEAAHLRGLGVRSAEAARTQDDRLPDRLRYLLGVLDVPVPAGYGVRTWFRPRRRADPRCPVRLLRLADLDTAHPIPDYPLHLLTLTPPADRWGLEDQVQDQEREVRHLVGAPGPGARHRAARRVTSPEISRSRRTHAASAPRSAAGTVDTPSARSTSPATPPLG